MALKSNFLPRDVVTHMKRVSKWHRTVHSITIYRTLCRSTSTPLSYHITLISIVLPIRVPLLWVYTVGSKYAGHTETPRFRCNARAHTRRHIAHRRQYHGACNGFRRPSQCISNQSMCICVAWTCTLKIASWKRYISLCRTESHSGKKIELPWVFFFFRSVKKRRDLSQFRLSFLIFFLLSQFVEISFGLVRVAIHFGN